MFVERRILSPIAATLLAGAVVAGATFGGSLAGDAKTAKTDRFAVVGDQLCEGQAWPNLSAECLAWAEGEPLAQSVRFITVAKSDAASGTTTLERIREIPTH